MREVASSMSDTLWSDDYTGFASDVSAGEVVYRVSTADLSARQAPGRTFSSAAVIATSENVSCPMPSHPGGTDENAIFRPEFSFHPENMISGYFQETVQLLFPHRVTPAKDGRQAQRQDDAAGVYLWNLRLTTLPDNP